MIKNSTGQQLEARMQCALGKDMCMCVSVRLAVVCVLQIRLP